MNLRNERKQGIINSELNEKPMYLVLGVLIFLVVFTFYGVPSRIEEIELKPIEDAYIDDYYVNIKFGRYHFLVVGVNLTGGYCVSYIKFDIPEKYEKVLEATINTYWYNFNSDKKLSLTVGTTSNNWNESTITWNTAPNYMNNTLSRAFIGDMENFMFDVQRFISEGGHFSIIIFGNNYSSVDYLQSDSWENDRSSSKPPILTIRYLIYPQKGLTFILTHLIIIGILIMLGVMFHIQRI